MTVIAAQYCDNYILMTTDSKGTYSQQGKDTLVIVDAKLNILTSPPLAWAYDCAVDIGEDFDRWLNSYQWKPQINWDDFRYDAVAKLNNLNGAKRKSMKDTGIETKPSDVTDVLIAGYIGQIPEILEIDK